MRAWVLSAGCALAGFTMLHAQVLASAPAGAAVQAEGFAANDIVRGKPFSATQERRTLQTLRDGTHLDNGEKNRIYRDGQGRTRMEAANGTITIFDPVAGIRIVLDPAAKTARREVPAVMPPILDIVAATVNSQPAKAAPQVTSTLKPQMVNGVIAMGTRTIMTIPKGQIGNDRDIKVVTERWISDDLQTLIKSTNTDPRYGETTYQLTGIVQREPDPSLFQIPADYAVIPETGRGGRSPAPGGVLRGGARGTVIGGRSTVPGARGPGPGGRSTVPGGRTAPPPPLPPNQ